MASETRNTRVNYMYRDGSNYKQQESRVFAGEITPEEQKQIMDTLGVFESFLPEQVGLETLYQRWPSHYDDDGAWHTLTGFELVPHLPDATITIHEFAAQFDGIIWDVGRAQVALDDWIKATPQGPIGEQDDDDEDEEDE